MCRMKSLIHAGFKLIHISKEDPGATWSKLMITYFWRRFFSIKNINIYIDKSEEWHVLDLLSIDQSNLWTLYFTFQLNLSAICPNTLVTEWWSRFVQHIRCWAPKKIGNGVWPIYHFSDVIMSALASQITGVSIIYSTVYSGTDQRKHQNSASLALVGGIHRWPVNSPHKGRVTQKMLPFDDVITLTLGPSLLSWFRVRQQSTPQPIPDDEMAKANPRIPSTRNTALMATASPSSKDPINGGCISLAQDCFTQTHFDGLVQKRRNSSALRLSCISPSI